MAALISFNLARHNTYFPAIFLWANGEVDPVAALLVPLDEEFIKISFGAIGNVQKDVRITDSLLNANASNIHGATR